MIDENQAVGIMIGERPEKNRFDDAEDRCVCADSEGKCKNGNGSKPGAAEQHSRAEAHVLHP